MSKAHFLTNFKILKFNLKLTQEHFFPEIHEIENFYSHFLEHDFRVDIYLPPSFFSSDNRFPLLFFNDGQDLQAVGLAATLAKLYAEDQIREIIVVGIHAHDRLQEYGVAHHPDYKQRGAKAAAYHQFIVGELLPFLQLRYKASRKPKHLAFAGFSLGGLSAFDLVWEHHELFRKVGVFSGSFWWRSQEFTSNDPDAHRIMHDLLADSRRKKGVKFWLQTGTLDETDDRNNNGIIDSIDDTLDIVKHLERLGYSLSRSVRYVEVEGGEHNPATWAKVLPDFLEWAFGW